MPTSGSDAEEVHRLRRTMRDLVALSTLPAVWGGYAPEGVAGSLAEILLNTLSLDLIYVRVRSQQSSGDIEVVRANGLTADAGQARAIAEALAPWLTPGGLELPPCVADPIRGGDLRVAVARFGHSGDEGAVVACSRRPDFPAEADRLLLGVGTNQTAIVLQRKRAEHRLYEERERLRITLSSIGDAVIATDIDGRVTFLNRVAESLTGWALAEAVGRPLLEIFQIVNEHTRLGAEDPALRALREGTVVGLANHTVLIARDGTARPIDDSAAPMRGADGAAVGSVLVFRDVTERKRAEEAQARLAAIVESSEDAIVSKSLDGVIQSWNAGAERLFGYAPHEAVGRHITLIIPPERTDEEHGILERLRRGERVEHFETVRVSKDGRCLDVSLTISPVRNAEGRVVGASKIARDVSEKRRAEAENQRLHSEVEAERRRLAELFRSAPSFMCVLRGPGHVFERANERYFQLLGRRDIIGKPVREAVPEVEGQGFFEILDRVYQTGEPFAATDMKIMLRRGGRLEERILEFVYQPVREADGAVAGILAHGIDLTERKRAEAAVRQRDERLQLFLENATDYAVIITDPAGEVLEWLGGAAKITGWRPEEMNGKPAAVLFTAEERAAGMPEAEMTRAAATGRAEDKRWHVRKDGSLFFADGVMVPLPGQAGKLRGFGKVFRDATEHKAMEDALREADRKKDDFIALLAHELRNPLAPIRNGLQVIRLAAGDPKAADGARAMMDRQLSHMVRLIDDLLDVSRISRNKMELRCSRVLLTDVVSSAVETARPVIDAEGHELTVSLPQRPVFLDADLTRLAQVFSNLLTNSAKYTERGGHIRLIAETRNGEVIVSVRDTGIGIPPESLGNIFDMFSQVDRSVERSTGGLGIGLALVRGLVEMHGGTVTAESGGQGQGSTFVVTLPTLPAEPVPAPAAPDNGQVVSGPKRRILVVDDNRDGADSLALMLRLLGHEVQTAYDGAEGVEQAEAFGPQVILMDVGMPKLNGLDAARRIRQQPWGRDVSIIALTGWGQDGDRERSREAGCNGHLVKPVNLPDLQNKLAELHRKDD